MLIDPIIAARLRVTIENLFQASNQAIYLENAYRFTYSPARCMVKHLHGCIDELGQIIKDVEPEVIDTGFLTIEEDMLLMGYSEIKRGLVKSWEFVAERERIIIDQAKTRLADQGGAGQ